MTNEFYVKSRSRETDLLMSADRALLAMRKAGMTNRAAYKELREQVRIGTEDFSNSQRMEVIGSD